MKGIVIVDVIELITFLRSHPNSIEKVPLLMHSQYLRITHDAHHLFMELGRKFSKTIAKSQRSARDAKKMREFAKAFRQIARFSTALADHENIPSTENLVRKLFEVDSDA